MIAIFPEIVQCAAKGDIERLALLCRKYFAEKEKFAPQMNLQPLLENCGIEVQELPLDCQGALLAKDEKGAFRIVAVIDPGIKAIQKRFLLAHQLGHYLLDIQPFIAKGDFHISGFREIVSPLDRYSIGSDMPELPAVDLDKEHLADDFAAALLLPMAMTKRALEKIADELRVAEFFGVTRECLKRRLDQLGLSSEAPINFLDAETRIQKMSGSGPGSEKIVSETTSRSALGSLRDEGSSHSASAPQTRDEGRLLPDQAPQIRDRSTLSPAPLTGNSAKGPMGEKARLAANYLSQQSKGGRAVIHKAPSQDGATPVLKGMERIRELARKIDKGVDP
jgi:hypothetical protein